MLSQTAEYALRAVLLVAREPGGTPVGAARLAAALGIPRNYLSKTLHQLGRSGVLASTRGKTGGFQLARPGEEISLIEIVTPFDDLPSKRYCLLGRTVCNDQTPCAAHARWSGVAEQIGEFFRETTVADLVRDGGRLGRL